MSKEIVAAQVRLVRCPKCGRLLPEIANIPVYQCGACQTTLQAKNRSGRRSASEIRETPAEAIHLPPEKREEQREEELVERLQGQRQRHNVDEFQSRQDNKQNWESDSSSSDDNRNGVGCSERVTVECFRGDEEEIDLAHFSNSRKLPLNHTAHGPRPPPNDRKTQLMSNTQNLLYHSHSERVEEKTEERSDGSSARHYHSSIDRLGNRASSSSSEELVQRVPRPRQGTRSSTHSKTLTNTVSNLTPPNALSNDLQNLQHANRGSVKHSSNSRHQSPVFLHEENTGAKTRSDGVVFRGLPGSGPNNGKVLCRPVDDYSTEWDYSTQIDSEVDMVPNHFDLQSAPKNMNSSSLKNQSMSTQLELQFQKRERNMYWQNHSHRKLQSQVREQNSESNPRTNKMDYLQINNSFQPSKHGQQSQGVKERWPRLSGNKPLESDISDFYMNSKGSLQFNGNYENGEVDYTGNLPQMHETEIQILQKRMELLKKLDELRDQLSMSCQVAYSSTVEAQHNIGTTIVTSETRPVVVERELSLKGHGGAFLPTANDVESQTWEDYLDGSQQSLGPMAYDPRIRSIPLGEQDRMHLEHDSLHGMMDEDNLSNGFASKHINPRAFGHMMSHALYVDKRNATPHRIPQMPHSGEQGLKPQFRTYHVPHRSMNEEQNSYTCSCCSRHFLQHAESCCSCPYQDRHPLHMRLHVSPTGFCHQQVHTATNHMHFNNSFPTRVGAQATMAHHHPHSYRDGSDIERSKSQESELFRYQEKNYAQEPAARIRRTLPCSPFAGGAPFVLCDNCLQLLLIPRNLFPTVKKKHKLRCGTCFSIFLLTIQFKQHGITVAKHTDYPSRYMQDSCSKVQHPEISVTSHATSSSSTIQNMPTNGTPHSHGNGYDIFVSKSHSANGKHDILQLAPVVQHKSLKSGSLSSESHLPVAIVVNRLQDFSIPDCDSSQKYSHEMRSCEARDNCAKAEASSVPDVASPMAGSPLHEHFGYSSPLEMINKFQPEKTTIASHQKTVDSGKSNHSDNTSARNHTKMDNKSDVSDSLPCIIATLETSKDVAEMEYQEDLSKESSRSWNTSIKGFLKKGFKDLKKGTQGLEAVRSNVFVNGRPITDNSVKKAEEHAGPIQPGHYWYDYQAGFWGLMAEPCLGIIPPFIEEFNYPMPCDCAGGKTRILVNGRELHQKDLDLLAGRGLPTTKDKSYHVEISGRIVDKATHTELKSLGKLAPT
ncbi:hypothetical protein KI387_036554, partial [Taxus chinensis]